MDIYSLGLIFFEMCYRPLKTGMERLRLFGGLRKATAEFPDDFSKVTMARQVQLCKTVVTNLHVRYHNLNIICRRV